MRMDRQLHAGILQKGKSSSVWHTDSEGNYWCGQHYSRTPRQLLAECLTTMSDLLVNHPDILGEENER